jgi:hypothetical protein
MRLTNAVEMAVTRPIGQIKAVNPKAIWQPEEVPSDDEDDDAFETRARPKCVDALLGTRAS